MADLEAFRRIHLVGVGGIGMSGLAKLLAQSGHQVSGSDLKPGRALAELAGLGVEVWVGHRPERSADWDLVVASSAVPERDPEMAAAHAAGVEVWHRPRLLEAMTRRAPAIGVSGTHGKTTGTAMAVAALRALGRDPSFMVGGRLVDLNTNAHRGEPGLFVLEADEAFGTILDLHLAALAVTNVEADHLDYYGTTAAVEEAFLTAAGRVQGPVVACLDDPGARRLAERLPGVIGYGLDPGAAWRIGAVGGFPRVGFLHSQSRWRRGGGERAPARGARGAQRRRGARPARRDGLRCRRGGRRPGLVRGRAPAVRGAGPDSGHHRHRRLRPPSDRSGRHHRRGPHGGASPGGGRLPAASLQPDCRARRAFRRCPGHRRPGGAHRRLRRRGGAGRGSERTPGGRCRRGGGSRRGLRAASQRPRRGGGGGSAARGPDPADGGGGHHPGGRRTGGGARGAR